MVNIILSKTKYNSILGTTRPVIHLSKCHANAVRTEVPPTQHHRPAHGEPTLAPPVTSRAETVESDGGHLKKKRVFSISIKLVGRRKSPKGKNRGCSKYGPSSSLQKRSSVQARHLSSRYPPLGLFNDAGHVYDEKFLPPHDREHREHRGSALPGAACCMGGEPKAGH